MRICASFVSFNITQSYNLEYRIALLQLLRAIVYSQNIVHSQKIYKFKIYIINLLELYYDGNLMSPDKVTLYIYISH